MKRQKITLYYGNGNTETIVTSNPNKAKRIYGAESYVPLGVAK